MTDSNPNREPDSDLDPTLEAAVRSVFSTPLDPKAIRRVKARANAIQPRSSIVSRIESPFISRSFLVKSLTAVVAVTVLIGASFLLVPSPSAFAEAIKKLRDARSFSYVNQIYKEGATTPISVKIFVAEDGRQRHENSGVITIMDADLRIRLTLIEMSKTALVSEGAQTPSSIPKRHPLEWLESLRSHNDKPDERLGRKNLDGRDVEGFVARQASNSYSIWIDANTKELVRIESDFPVKGSSISKTVKTDFRFNETFDESLFSLDIPEGYKQQVTKQFELLKKVSGEANIVEALHGFTERSGGKFPKSISEWSEWTTLVSKANRNGQLDKDSTELMSQVGRILPFLMSLKKDGYEYVGAGKSTDDQRCIVFWYRNKSGRLRAIYNDFSIADVEQDDLPK